MATTPKKTVERENEPDPIADSKPTETAPEHDPGHGRWILDPVTGEKRNNHEEA